MKYLGMDQCAQDDQELRCTGIMTCVFIVIAYPDTNSNSFGFCGLHLPNHVTKKKQDILRMFLRWAKSVIQDSLGAGCRVYFITHGNHIYTPEYQTEWLEEQQLIKTIMPRVSLIELVRLPHHSTDSVWALIKTNETGKIVISYAHERNVDQHTGETENTNPDFTIKRSGDKFQLNPAKSVEGEHYWDFMRQDTHIRSLVTNPQGKFNPEKRCLVM